MSMGNNNHFNSNRITGKELKMERPKFNEIGAKTKLTLLD